jgi:hypothetical protein
MTKRFAMFAAVSASVLTVLLASAGQASARSECSTPGSRTLAATDSARVFVKRRRVYGCLFSVGRPFLLDDDARVCRDACAGVRRLTISGRFVAWARHFSSRSAAATSVMRTDLRARRSVLLWTSGEITEGSDWRVDALASTRSGDVAWIASVFRLGVPVTYTVHASVGGDDRELASGMDIDPSSFAVGGRFVYWLAGQEVRSYALR